MTDADDAGLQRRDDPVAHVVVVAGLLGDDGEMMSETETGWTEFDELRGRTSTDGRDRMSDDLVMRSYRASGDLLWYF